MSTLGTTTILGDLTVTGQLKANDVGSVTGDYLPTTGGNLTGELSLINSYPCISMVQNTGKARMITDNNSWWVEGSISGTVRSRMRFDLDTGELYVKNNTSRVYHQNFKPTSNDVLALKINTLHASDWTSASAAAGKTFVGGWHGAGGNCYFSFGSSTGACDLMIDGNVYVQEGSKQLIPNHSNLNIGTTGKAYIGANTNAVNTVPVVTLAIGDADTGLHWHSDGNFSLFANNVQAMNITTGGVACFKPLTAGGGINRFISNCNTVGSDYFHTSIEIRETNQVATTQRGPEYAPSLGFHWGGTTAASLAMHSDGAFHFRGQGYTGTQYRDIIANNYYIKNASGTARLPGCYWGTAVPSNSVGQDGDIYIQYT